YDLVNMLLSYVDLYPFEIIVSNNGSTNDTLADYEKIAQINHPRLHYHKNNTNLGFVGNFHTILSLSKTLFSMILSDEDFLNTDELTTLFSLLERNDNIGLMLSLTTNTDDIIVPSFKNQINQLTILNIIGNTYISGVIYNNQAIKKLNILEKLKIIPQENALYTLYPHLLVNLLLADEYPCLFLKAEPILRGKIEESSLVHEKIEAEYNLFEYARHENRAKEFYDFIWLLLFFFGQGEERKTLDQILCFFDIIANKYLFLMNLSAYLYTRLSVTDPNLATPQEIFTLYEKTFDVCFKFIIETYGLYEADIAYEQQKQLHWNNVKQLFIASLKQNKSRSLLEDFI
ncbi:MAG: glycosyltransferase, partial [Oscillospiraceae bacterium]